MFFFMEVEGKKGTTKETVRKSLSPVKCEF